MRRTETPGRTRRDMREPDGVGDESPRYWQVQVPWRINTDAC